MSNPSVNGSAAGNGENVAPEITRDGRNPAIERTLLTAATAGQLPAEAHTFTRHVTDRLAMGQREYGNRWRSAGIKCLLAELADEAADLGAWGVLAAQSPDLADLDPDGSALRAVATAMRCGAIAHASLEAAAAELERVADAAE